MDGHTEVFDAHGSVVVLHIPKGQNILGSAFVGEYKHPATIDTVNQSVQMARKAVRRKGD